MRLNIYNKGKLIGQDYQRENGDWMHKWVDHKTGTFERGSWRGRCHGDTEKAWTYEDADNAPSFWHLLQEEEDE